jgi:flagellar basal body-associated protein FliL
MACTCRIITFSLIVVLALAGLPIVLLIAWAMGHKKEEATEETSAARANKKKLVKKLLQLRF